MAEGEKSIGAIWVKEKEGKGKWLSIQIEIDGEKYSMVAFKNRYKEQDKHPDYKIFLSKKKGEEGDPF